MNQVLNSAANSGPSVGASSLVTDANSALSGGAQLQRSASTNTDSFMRLPASPMSFSSGNISMSGSSVMDGSSLAQQSGSSITRLESNQDQTSQQQQLQQRQQQGVSTPTSQQKMQQTPQQQVASQQGQVPGTGPQLAGQQMLGQQSSGSCQQLGQQQLGQRLPAQGLISPKREKNDLLMQPTQVLKSVKQEEGLQQQGVQQIIQRPENMLGRPEMVAQFQRQESMQRHSPQFHAILQQRVMQQQQQQQQQHQQLLQSLPQHLQRAHLHQHQQQLRHHMQQHIQPPSLTKQPAMEIGSCARRLMQYIYHQRHRQPENSITFWRDFVAEYFAPHAKKRWCLSMYGNVGHHTLGVFPQAAMDVWQCEICKSKPGRGFETTVEVLPRLCKIKFDSGVVDELLFVDMPQEYRLHSGLMVLEYGKAIQESVYEQLRVVRNGQLRIIFTPDLKILSWEFCARSHEELLPRRLVAPQVNQLAMVAQKYQTAAAQSGSSGLSAQDLQSNCNMFVATGRQLARNLELQSLNDLGFSKRYVRCLQISEVVNSMKDLIDFSRENNMGPIESLNNFPRQTVASKLQSQQMQQGDPMPNIQGTTSDQNNMKMNPMHANMNNQMNNHLNGTVNNSSQNAAALSNYHNILCQNSMPTSQNTLQQEASCSYGGPSQTPSCNSLQSPSHSISFQGALSSMPLQNTSLIGLSNPIKQNSVGANLLQQTHPQSSQVNQQLTQQMVQQLLQEMMNNGGTPPQALVGQGSNGNVVGNMLNGLTGSGGPGIGSNAVRSAGMIGNGLGYGNNNMSNIAGNLGSGLGGVGNLIPGRSNSFRNLGNNSMPMGNIGSSGFGGRLNLGAVPQQQNLHLQDVVQDLPHEFTDNGMSNSMAANGDAGDMQFSWKSY
uniref:TSA: Wollemia nobilis Ref_Wollemi_Transcript_4892_3755 transcribed RNA sequence n=1 Tax=Wollemia nobilis TaxID=56998 RepID=A0A0C9S8D5_9CONI